MTGGAGSAEGPKSHEPGLTALFLAVAGIARHVLMSSPERKSAQSIVVERK
jgi:hypothetical protein